MTNEEIIATNGASALEAELEREHKDSQLAELRASEFLQKASRHRPLYSQEDTKEDFLAEIVAENVKSARNNHYE